MADPTEFPNKFNFFEVGRVQSVDTKNASCKIVRAEGGVINNVPILNTLGSGGQSTGYVSFGNLANRMVLLVNVQGVLCVLATIPEGNILNQRIV